MKTIAHHLDTIKLDDVIKNTFFFVHLSRLCTALAPQQKDQTTTTTALARDRVKRQQRKNHRAQKVAMLNYALTLK